MSKKDFNELLINDITDVLDKQLELKKSRLKFDYMRDFFSFVMDNANTELLEKIYSEFLKK